MNALRELKYIAKRMPPDQSITWGILLLELEALERAEMASLCKPIAYDLPVHNNSTKGQP